MTNEALDAVFDAAREMIANAVRKYVCDLNSGADLHDKEFRGAKYALRIHSIHYSKSSDGRNRDDISITVRYSWQDPRNGQWVEQEDDPSVFSCDELFEIIEELEKVKEKDK